MVAIAEQMIFFVVVGTEVWGMESEDSIWCHRRVEPGIQLTFLLL